MLFDSLEFREVVDSRKGQRAVQASHANRAINELTKRRVEIEQQLHEAISAILPAPRTAFQMFAQDQLDQMEREGTQRFEPKTLQHQLVAAYNQLGADVQARLQARGQEHFRTTLQHAHDIIRKVSLSAIWLCLHAHGPLTSTGPSCT
jgi:hypothetical protein